MSLSKQMGRVRLTSYSELPTAMEITLSQQCASCNSLLILAQTLRFTWITYKQKKNVELNGIQEFNKNRINTRKKARFLTRSVRQLRITRTNLQPKHAKLYMDLKANNSANDVTKLTINDYIMQHR